MDRLNKEINRIKKEIAEIDKMNIIRTVEEIKGRMMKNVR